MKSILLFTLFILPFVLTGQRNDTLKLADLFGYVRATHPVIKQSELLPQMAKQELRLARGAFDPTIDLHFNRKDLWNYKEKWQPATYYESWQHFFKVPTWLGDVKFGFERYNGINVNPENFTPPQGLAYVELTIPLARGLLLDPRRAAVKQAEILRNLNEAERQKIVNKLLFQIAKDYYQWVETYRKLEIQRQTYRLAADRLAFVKDRVIVGDLAPIDSVEAVTEVQKRFLTLRESEMAFANAAQLLSVHLWNPEGNPVELSPNVIPEKLALPRFKPRVEWLDSLQKIAEIAHPELLKLKAKQQILEIDRKLRKQELLPTFDFDLKPFFLPATNDPKLFLDPNYSSINYWTQNYKAGLNFYMPIFLRKERAKLEKANLKLLENNYEINFTRRDITADIFTRYNELAAYYELSGVQEKNVRLSRQLFEAETERFRNGESSLFLINSRERSLLSEQEKAIELQIKYLKSFADALHSAGRPQDNR